MRRGIKSGSGFTILETMIVMAVSASMLATAILLFSGQQRKTQFSQSIRDAESKLQDVLNDVSTGYFPSASNAACSATGNVKPSIDTSGTSEQGANYACVFMGKAILFKPDGFVAYPIVGNRGLATSASANSTLSDVKPIIATSLVEEKSFLWGLHIYDIFWNDATDRSSTGAMIAIASSANGTGTAAGGAGFNPGIQKLNMYSSGTAAGTPVDINELVSANAEVAVESALNNSGLSWVTGDLVVMCVEDDTSGSSRKFGGIILSGGSRSVEARIQQPGDGVQCV